MNKQLMIVGITVLLLAIGLSGCEENIIPISSEEGKFVGTWEHESAYNTITIMFKSDGKYESYGQPIYGAGSYEVRDGEISLNLSNTNLVLTYDYDFSNDDQGFTLISESGSSITYTKQKTTAIYNDIVTIEANTEYSLPPYFDWQIYNKSGYLINNKNAKYVIWDWEVLSGSSVDYNIIRYYPINDDFNNEHGTENMYFKNFAYSDSSRLKVTTENNYNYWSFHWGNENEGENEDTVIQSNIFTTIG